MPRGFCEFLVKRRAAFLVPRQAPPRFGLHAGCKRAGPPLLSQPKEDGDVDKFPVKASVDVGAPSITRFVGGEVSPDPGGES